MSHVVSTWFVELCGRVRVTLKSAEVVTSMATQSVEEAKAVLEVDKDLTMEAVWDFVSPPSAEQVSNQTWL